MAENLDVEMRENFYEARCGSKMLSTKGTEAPPRSDPHIQFIAHLGKKILLVDLSNCSAVEVEKTMRALPDVVTAQARGSVLILGDFTGTSFNRDAFLAIKETAVFDKPYVKKSAWVGTENLPKKAVEQFHQFCRRTFLFFPNRDQALAWLAKD